MRNPKIVQVRIDNFQQRDPTSNAHPYIWVAFFKADGATLSVTAAGDVSGDCVVVSSPGSHGDLGNPLERANSGEHSQSGPVWAARLLCLRMSGNDAPASRGAARPLLSPADRLLGPP
jgi:hypothetical protein